MTHTEHTEHAQSRRAGIHRQRPGAQAMEAATGDPAVQVADGVWMHPGLSNTYLIQAPEGRIVINTGMGFEGPLHRAAFDAVGEGPIAAVVLTQGHYDHVGGIGHFVTDQESPEVIVGEEWRTWRADNDRLLQFRVDRSAFAFTERVTEGFRRSRRAAPDADITQGEAAATLEVSVRQTVTLAGIDFELIPMRGGETRDSLVLWWPERRIAFTGNLLGPLFGHVPNLVTIRGDRYRDALDYIETVETLQALGAETIFTGHFDPIVGAEVIDQELGALVEAMQSVHDQVVAGTNAGTDVHTLMAQVQVPDHLDVGEGYGQTKWNVRAIWENYTGWFKASSTTELFAEPRSAVDGDLVALAGGPDPVAVAARTRLDENAPVLALHLAEVALRVDPEHREALQVAVDAHRMLLPRTTNFWEEHWLENQLTLLTARQEALA